MINNNFSMIRLVLKKLVFPYWTKSKTHWKASGLLALTVALILGIVYATVLMNHWNQAFYDAVQNLNKQEFYHQVGVFFGVAVLWVTLTAYRYFVIQNLGLNWRRWLTEENLQQWLSHARFYYWHLLPEGTDNPDQRLSEDLRELTELTLELGEKFFREFITFVSFIGILWGLSNSWIFPDVFGYKVELHKYLVWSCLIYAVLGSWLTQKIGRPLSKLNFMQERFEADFRFLLVRLRENSDSIALLHGEETEKKNLLERFHFLFENFREIIRRQKNLLLTTSIYGQIGYVFPFLVASPQIFTRVISLGVMFQIISAFGQVQGSVSVFVDMYSKLAQLNSVVLRLGGFLQSLHQHENLQNHQLKAGERIELQGVKLKTPQGQILQIPALSLQKGERLLLQGPTGLGKSSLIKLLNGLWPFFEGQGQRLQARSLTLPQNSYLPEGSLRDVISYPSAGDAFSNEEILRALRLAQMQSWSESLQVTANWSNKLSAGEQQLVGFARVFLHKPDLLFLDESTSALDENSQMRLYENLLKHLPGVTLLSIGHRNTLAPFHTQVIQLA